MASSHTSPMTALTCKTMLFLLQVTAVFYLLSLLSHCSSAYQLQDTIHTLKQENIQLQHRLKNLTHTLRDLKHLLTEYAKASGGKHYSQYLHAWKEWSQHGVNDETHQMLAQALCLSTLHDAAPSIFITSGFILLLSMMLSLLS